MSMSTLLLLDGHKPEVLSTHTPRAPTVNFYAAQQTKPEPLLQRKFPAEVDISHSAAFFRYAPTGLYNATLCYQKPDQSSGKQGLSLVC